jgi:ferredoxin
MSDMHERRIGDDTVQIDRTLCVGFGDCIEAAPELFAFDDEGICKFIDGVEEVERDRLIHACDICQVDALTVIDHDGNQVVP